MEELGVSGLGVGGGRWKEKRWGGMEVKEKIRAFQLTRRRHAVIWRAGYAEGLKGRLTEDTDLYL